MQSTLHLMAQGTKTSETSQDRKGYSKSQSMTHKSTAFRDITRDMQTNEEPGEEMA